MIGTRPRIAVEPKSGRYESLEAAVIAGGAELCSIEDAEGLIWSDHRKADAIAGYRSRASALRWISLPFAGIEPFVPYLTNDVVWTCAKGVYATPVAEHAIALGLAGLRDIVVRSKQHSWGPQVGTNLIGGNVTIFGGGGITSEIVRLLGPFDCTITVVRRSVKPMPGVANVVPLGDRLSAVANADLVILALALTEETRHVGDAALFESMQSHAWLVNVARGGHVDHDALLVALDAGSIGGAGLDVTDPEPLPDEHGLWQCGRVVITPHVANTPDMGVPLLAASVEANVARFGRGEPLAGVVDVGAGY